MNHPALCASVLACAAAGCVVGDDPRPLSQLFGTEGLSFTKTQFPEQAQAMASILRVIDKDELEAEIDELCGSESLILLRACQPRYEAMVEARLTRDARKSADLGKVRGAVMRGAHREEAHLNRIPCLARQIERRRLVVAAGRCKEARPGGGEIGHRNGLGRAAALGAPRHL